MSIVYPCWTVVDKPSGASDKKFEGTGMKPFWILLMVLGAAVTAGCLGGESKAPPATAGVNSSEPAGSLEPFLGDSSQRGQLPSNNSSFNNPSNPGGVSGPGSSGPSIGLPNSNGSAPSGAKVFIDPGKALKISMLRSGDRLEFGHSLLRLESIYYKEGRLPLREGPLRLPRLL